MNIKVGVIGSGSFGLTMAKVMSENSDILLYSRRLEKVNSINSTRTLKGIALPENIVATNDLEKICAECKLIIPVIPAASMRTLLQQMCKFLTPSHFLIHATKGLDYDAENTITKDNVFTMSQVIAQETSVVRIGCISGPNLSKEILAGQPTATVVASEFDEVIAIGRQVLNGKAFFVFGSHNILGVELAGALKNVFAIGSGLLGGLDLGKNLQALLITRGLGEMIKLGEALGAQTEPFLGSAGIGDLIATATSDSSRNYTFGKLIAKGNTIAQAKEIVDEVAEGVHTLNVVRQLARNLNMNLPICEFIYHIVYNNYPLSKALDKIMFYPSTDDVEFM